VSYHRDEHWFDFDSDLLDALYPMTDLDHQISKHGAGEALNKVKKPMDNTVRLEFQEESINKLESYCKEKYDE
tara:strand:+ start:166 stop:384 length:219 start_codon:yes stop_codon:yes gene_type:complete